MRYFHLLLTVRRVFKFVTRGTGSRTPIASADHDFGASEIIEDGRSGILVPVENPEKMAEAVLMLLRDRALATKMGEEARKRVWEFSIEKMIRENLQIFRGEVRKKQETI